MEKILTATEAAQKLGCSRAWVFDLCQSGRLGRKVGARWVITIEELETFEKIPRKSGVPLPTPKSERKPRIEKNSRYCAHPECDRKGTLLPNSEFYVHKVLKSGRASWCKQCASRYKRTEPVKARQRERHNTEKGRAYFRTWSDRPEQRERRKKYRKQVHRVLADRERAKRMRVKFSERARARDAVNRAVVAGELPAAKTLTCQRCPQQAEHYHHENGYDREHWLDVIPLCLKCHGRAHRID